jgi:YggT family protein
MSLFYLVHLCFSAYTLLIFVRIISSWIPEINQYHFMLYVYEYTEPYLAFFRRIIPPLGMMDLSPMAALISLHFLESIILGLFRL